MIAALYVETGGVYYGLDEVDPWDVDRDAREYRGPHPVVAHPPCQKWGPLAKVNEARYGYPIGDDAGCFARALWAVRTFGGVLEHPRQSYAWDWHGIRRPPDTGGWWAADGWGGWTCCVEQGHYGHRARKATWLYVVACDLPGLQWGRSEATHRISKGPGSDLSKAYMPKGERHLTPIPFRDLLINLARTAVKP